MKYIFSLVLIMLLLVTGNVSAGTFDVDAKVEKIYKNFISKIENDTTESDQLIFLNKLDVSISTLLDKKSLKNSQKELLHDLLILNREKVFSLENELENFDQEQISLEQSLRNDIIQKTSVISEPSFVSKITKKYKIYKVTDQYEFVEGDDLKRMEFSEYFSITNANYRLLRNNTGILLLLASGEVRYVETYEEKTKIPYSQMNRIADGFVTPNVRFYEEDGAFYGYNFRASFTYDDVYGLYEKDLFSGKYKGSDFLLYKNNEEKYTIVRDYDTLYLIQSDIIYGVPSKRKFLEEVLDDVAGVEGKYDQHFEELKSITESLVQNKTEKERIEIIYDWLLNNVSYTQNPQLEDSNIFSGILTYKNSVGVCEGYVKLFSYMLDFADVGDVSVIRGDIVDAFDFPRIGHAWVKIGNVYYDPTFDDPVGAAETLESSQYKYFGLPKDLFYANRFDYGETPDSLKTKSLQFRENFVTQRLTELVVKYGKHNYNVLEEAVFLQDHNLPIGKSVSFEAFMKLLQVREVIQNNSGEIYFLDDSGRKDIAKLEYVVVNSETDFNSLLAQFDFNVEDLYLFYWNLPTGGQEIRVGINVEFR